MGKLLLLILFAAPILCYLLGTPVGAATYYRHPSGTAENKEAATGPCTDTSAAMPPSVYYSEEFADGDIVWFCKTKKWIPGKFWSSRLFDVSTTITIAIPTSEYILLVDGTSKFLLVNGTDKLIRP